MQDQRQADAGPVIEDLNQKDKVLNKFFDEKANDQKKSENENGEKGETGILRQKTNQNLRSQKTVNFEEQKPEIEEITPAQKAKD